MPSTKKKFVDIPESLLLEIDNLKSEVQALRRTVDSKSRAVVILRKQFATLKERAGIHESCEKETQTAFKGKETSVGSPERESHHNSNNVLVELLSVSKKENKSLRQDILNLRCKLHDALADLKVVRSETPLLVAGGGGSVAAVQGPLQHQWQRQERLHLISQLEALTDKVSTLTSDVRCLTADRDELLREREHSRVTISRLSSALRAVSAEPPDPPLLQEDRRSARRSHSTASDLSVHNCASPTVSDDHTQNSNEKLRSAEREIARLESIIADYELLASLQRASQHAPHVAHGLPHRGSDGDIKKATTVAPSLSSPAAGAPGVTDVASVALSANLNAEDEIGNDASELRREEPIDAAAGGSSGESLNYQQDVTTPAMLPDGKDPSISHGQDAVDDEESSDKYSFSPQLASSDSQSPSNSSGVILEGQDSSDELSESDRRLQETQKWLSRLQVTEECLPSNEYFGTDIPEEIVSIEDIGKRKAASLHAFECKSKSASKDMSSAMGADIHDNSVESSLALPSNDASTTAGASAARAPDNMESGGGFSDYDSDDDNFEAQLNQWQKSAGVLLSKAQKNAD